MKEFFFNLLRDLEKLTGMKQWDRFMSIQDPDLRKKEVNELLEILCRTSDLFPLIPKNDQKAIIRQAVISDPEFIGLNAKIVYKWLHAQKDRFFKELAHQPSQEDPNAKPVEGEERQEWLRKWMESLGSMDERNQELKKSHVWELEKTLPEKKGIAYRSTPPEEVLQKALHIDYVRSNYDKDGNKLPTWEDESTWLTKHTKVKHTQ